MPLVRVTRSIAFLDGRAYQPGDVQMSPEQAQEATRGGWGHLVREEPPETPERARAQLAPTPELADRERIGGYPGGGDRDTMGPPPATPSAAASQTTRGSRGPKRRKAL